MIIRATHSFFRTARALVVLTANMGIALSVAASAQAASPFANGKGVNIPSAVLGTRTTPDSPSVYKLQPSRSSPALFAQVKASGFGFVRLVTTPAPLMTNDAAALQRALIWLGMLVDRANAAGLAVIVDLHPWPSDGQWSQDRIIADPDHRALLGRAQVALARALAAKKGARVALELLNEPPCAGPGASDPTDWPAIQLSMERAVRAAAPTLPLILTSCRGLPDKLAAIDAKPYANDPGIYWTLHYYRPATFVFQEQSKLEDIPFPPDPSLAGSPSALRAMIPLTTLAAHPGDLPAVRTYLTGDRGVAAIADDMGDVAAWAKRSGVSPSHILVGEFGTSTSAKNPDLPKVHISDLHWFIAVRSAAEQRGFAWAFWPMPEPTNANYDPQTGFFKADVLSALGIAGRQ